LDYPRGRTGSLKKFKAGPPNTARATLKLLVPRAEKIFKESH
jgi:hypothetical protein